MGMQPSGELCVDQDQPPTPEQLELLARQIQVVEQNAQLVIGQLHAVDRRANQAEATLALLVGLIGAHAELDGGYLLHRISQDMRLCAESPEIAAAIAQCDPDHVAPEMIRTAASAMGSAEPYSPPARPLASKH
jgi:hypothetical protein